uniref:Uncharacterized protein n=1 Tax=Rhizophora mucronata TaxID=61149 RepID=A0A2P2NPF2_RHIMU
MPIYLTNQREKRKITIILQSCIKCESDDPIVTIETHCRQRASTLLQNETNIRLPPCTPNALPLIQSESLSNNFSDLSSISDFHLRSSECRQASVQPRVKQYFCG